MLLLLAVMLEPLKEEEEEEEASGCRGVAEGDIGYILLLACFFFLMKTMLILVVGTHMFLVCPHQYRLATHQSRRPLPRQTRSIQAERKEHLHRRRNHLHVGVGVGCCRRLARLHLARLVDLFDVGSDKCGGCCCPWRCCSGGCGGCYFCFLCYYFFWYFFWNLCIWQNAQQHHLRLKAWKISANGANYDDDG